MQALKKSFSICNLDSSQIFPFLLALGLFLTVCGTLRMVDGVGFGELILLALAALGWVRGDRNALLINPFCWFWCLLTSLMALGFVFGGAEGIWVKRDALAYAFAAFFSLGLILLLGTWSDQQLKSTLWSLVAISLPMLWLGFVVYLSGDARWISGLRMDDQGASRYTAWSTNANQLALFFVPLPIWLLMLRPINGRLGYAIWSMVFASALLMGLVVKSDALVLSWGVGLLSLIALAVVSQNYREVRWLLGVSLIALAFLVIAKVFTSGDVRHTFHCSSEALIRLESPARCIPPGVLSGVEMMRTGYDTPSNKTLVRLTLWKNALKVVSESPIVGNGPGAYSWFDNSFLTGETTAEGRTPMEAHNIALDLMTQGGVVLGVAWIALVAWLLQISFAARSPYAFTWVLMLGLFTMFMYHLRHPYLWFALILAAESVRRRVWCAHKPLG